MPKVMLIEDDQTMVGLLTTLLGIEGYKVVTFIGGTDVFSFVQSEKPDVIILDVNLSNFGGQMTNGFDLLAAIRKNDDLCQTSVIISSGMNYTVECKEAGADGFVMKPYMPDDLLALIRENIAKD
jgi:DNA-binding response OmpR family regulator